MENDQEKKALRPSILIVGTDSTSLSQLRNLFRRELLQLLYSPTYNDGMSILSSHRIDLIVVDANDNWHEVVEFLQKAHTVREESVRFVIGTSVHEPQAMEAVARGVAQRYLIKPWNEEQLKTMVVETVHLQHQQRLKKFEEKLSSFSSLPVPERFQTRLNQLLNKRDASLTALADEIEKSPALVAKLLQVANSVQYWTRAPISTIREAVIFIGTGNIISLVSALDIFERISHGIRPEIRAHYELLWERSLRRASIAKKIAEEWREAGQPHTAYVCSLLQDVGLLVRLCYESARYLEMISIARKSQVSYYQAELQIFSNTHDEVGALLLQMWNFPKTIIFAVANHHGKSYDDPLTQVMQIADILNPHDSALDPMIEIWRARLEQVNNGDENSPMMMSKTA